MNDIVQLLHELAECKHSDLSVASDGADEITALRAENERLRAALERLAKWRGDDLVTDGRVIQMENIARAALEGRT